MAAFREYATKADFQDTTTFWSFVHRIQVPNSGHFRARIRDEIP